MLHYLRELGGHTILSAVTEVTEVMLGIKGNDEPGYSAKASGAALREFYVICHHLAYTSLRFFYQKIF